jgi:uroporphyrinogen decarboxylase
METLLTDYYLFPRQVLRLNRGLCDQYLRYIRWAAEEMKPDGFFTSDDLGHQTGPMMNPATFHEFLYPFYCEVGAECRKHGLHFWLHSCGDNTLLLPDLVSSGLDVFHPVQKGTMDEKRTASEFGGRLSFLVGFDVQHALREGSPSDVRAEVRFLINTFDGPGGGLCLGAGNSILPGTPLENVDAFLDETLRYGAEHRARFA